jgi:hypothetical protein
MKRNISQWMLMGLFAGFLFAGCATRSDHAVTVGPNGQVMVADPQDRVRRELADVSGSGPYGWIKGYWTYMNSRWIWVPGRWEVPSNAGNWIDGHWDRGVDGWIWIPGHWA